MNVQDKLRAGLPVTVKDVRVPSLQNHYRPQTAQEARDWATALAVRDINRGFRRGVGEVLHRLDVMEARQAARRRFGPR